MAVKGLNLQQIPKLDLVTDCFVARPGCVLVDTDFTAIEPKVLAFFSRDPVYMELYNSGKPHDVYLYLAARLDPDDGPAITKLYCPEAPTAESVAAAKAAFKKKRSLWKEVHLASQYGAGAKTIHRTVVTKGLDVELDAVREWRSSYWRLFRTVKDFQNQLLAEREERGGWIFNGRGRALAITADKEMDILNTFVQSTAHDLLLTFLYYLGKEVKAQGLRAWPWLPNFHDQTVWEVEEQDAEDLQLTFQAAYDKLNLELKSDIPVSGEITVGKCLTKFKDVSKWRD